MRAEVYIPDQVYRKVSDIYEDLGFQCLDEALDWAIDAGLDNLIVAFETYKARKKGGNYAQD